MAKLFKTKDPSELRVVRVLIRLTKKEDQQIRHSASIRQMDVSEFIRRTALGRPANVDYETEIVVALVGLRMAINELRGLHATMVERGIQPPADDWRPVMLAARAAIERISK